MSKGAGESQSTQAYFTAIISTVISAICLYHFGDKIEQLRLALPIGALCAPFITLLLVKLFAMFNTDPTLTKYKSALERDLKKQKKILKDPLIDEATKKQVRRKYAETSLLLSSANLDHANGAVDISAAEDRIPG